MSKTVTEYINYKLEIVRQMREKYAEEEKYWRGEEEVLMELAQMIDMGDVEAL